MKKLSYLFIGLAATLATACDSWEPALESKTGQLDLTGLTPTVDTSATVITRAVDGSENAVDISNYIVTITDTRGDVVNRWTYSDVPEVVTLPVGEYTLSVASHEATAAEWDNPLYKGSIAAQITDGEITRAGAVSCRLAGAKVSVEYSESLKAALSGNYAAHVELSPEAALDFTGADTRTGCFNLLPSGDASFVATFNGTVNGNPVTVKRAVTGVTAGNHYKLTFSLSTGTIDPSIVVDVTVTEDDVDINIGADMPTITSQTLDLSGPILLTPENAESIIAIVDFNVPKGIKELHVKIQSDGLTPEILGEIGLTDNFDLCNPGEYAEALTEGLGFPPADEIIDKTEFSFDITFFMTLLCYFPGEHNFILTVVDGDGQSVVQPVIFSVPAE
ncbi:MAG: DUF4493 domain-containing protein [Muribaculaceae bacterium]|nr:DUF4493 domain-containing protein [Muribaculaceae bacterium]